MRKIKGNYDLHDHSTVDGDDLAGDVTCIGAGKEEGRAGDVVASAEFAHGNGFEDVGFQFSVQVGGHVGFDETGGDGVDGDGAGRQFAGDGLREPNQTGFAGRVVALAGVADEADDRRNVDDAAGALFGEYAKEFAGEMERAFEVGIHHDIPVLIAHAHEQTIAGDTGVIDQNIHASAVGYDFFRRGLDGGCGGHVDCQSP